MQYKHITNKSSCLCETGELKCRLITNKERSNCCERPVAQNASIEKPQKVSQTHAAGLWSSALDFVFFLLSASACHWFSQCQSTLYVHAACMHQLDSAFIGKLHLAAASASPIVWTATATRRWQGDANKFGRQRKAGGVFCWYLNLGQYFGVLCTPATLSRLYYIEWWRSFRVMYVITLPGLETIGKEVSASARGEDKLSNARSQWFIVARQHKRKVIV